MKVACLQENLSRGLGIVGRAVATRTTLPITNNVLLVTEESRLKLVATNLEIVISCWLGAKVEQEGAITVPARLLTEFINSLPNDRVEMELAPKGRVLELRCARFSARISGMDADDFPPMPALGEGMVIKADPDVLRQAISRVVFAAASDEARPVLTGVYAELDGDQVTFVAADGFRLAVQNLSLVEGAPQAHAAGEGSPARGGDMIIPARAMGELNRLLGDQEDPVEIVVSPNRSQVAFHLKNVDLVSQLIQGTFPNYSQLIPKSYGTRAVVDVGEFLRATRMASIFARDGSGIVRIMIAPGEGPLPGKLTISARAEEVGDNIGEIDALVEGEASNIAFNGRYLTDVLAVLGSGQVALETTTTSSPGVIRPVSASGGQDYTHVVMPMFVQW